jgi:glucosamine 6-phosphate synthetase-like amidotransferase/phosphosugar isomerase protein
MKEGETFESDTDTEIIPKLCKFLYRCGCCWLRVLSSDWR